MKLQSATSGSVSVVQYASNEDLLQLWFHTTTRPTLHSNTGKLSGEPEKLPMFIQPIANFDESILREVRWRMKR